MQLGKQCARALCLSALCISLAACSLVNKVFPDRKADYKKSTTVESLEVPPDLTASTLDDALVVPEITPSSSATFSDYRNERTGQSAPGSTVLSQPEELRVERDGDKQWLIVSDEADGVWPQVREFWLENGFLIETENPQIGILETGWSENRADIPRGPIRNVVGKVFDPIYSAATRDRFRVRLERGVKPGTTEIYLTHRGVEEVIQDNAEEQGTAVWRPRPSDPELEVEMLKRLMVYIGIQEDRAKEVLDAPITVPERAHLITAEDGAHRLSISEDFSRAWRRTGIALDRVGFAVEDRDRTEGIYYVRYNDPLRVDKKQGLLSKMAFWSDDEPKHADQFQIKLTSEGATTMVKVLDQAGQVEPSPTASRILKLLHEQLK